MALQEIISVLPGLKSPTVVAAQAANDLLNINMVKASFVMVEHQGKIYISGRSIDEVNVQVILEKLGGGGHLNMAGAQLEIRPWMRRSSCSRAHWIL